MASHRCMMVPHSTTHPFRRAAGRWPLPVLFISGFLLLSGCISISLGDYQGPLKETTVQGKGRDKILLIDISGMITNQESRSGLVNPRTKPSLVDRVRESLKKAERDGKIKAVILRINSPGGTVTASDIIYQELVHFKEETKLPIIANIMDLGTSGAYYVAQAADEIMAHPTAVTGSIGVVMIRANIQGLLEKIGVEAAEIKSGDKKLMGSPFRPMTPEEQAIFQKVITSMHHQFLSIIAENRPDIPRDDLVSAADGRIYTAKQAKELGLIDSIGYLVDAVKAAKKAAGIKKARVITYHREGYKGTIYSIGVEINLGELSSFTTPRFMYLWSP